MRAFVSGGSGFLGSHLVDRLLALDYEVTIFDQKEPIQDHQRPWTFIPGDLADKPHLTKAIAGHDLVCHLAANADVRFGTKYPSRDLEQNLLATANVLEAMRANDIKRIVFSSTAMVYGQQYLFPTPEDCAFPVQTSLYGASKVAAEGLISAYCHGFGMDAMIFRFVPVLGERYRHGHIFDFYTKLKADPDQIEVLGNGRQSKSYVYIADAISAIERVLSRDVAGVQIFNVGTQETFTVNQSLDVVCQEMGVQPTRTYSTAGASWSGDPAVILLDCTRLLTLGWLPTVGIRDAIIKTVRSFA